MGEENRHPSPPSPSLMQRGNTCPLFRKRYSYLYPREAVTAYNSDDDSASYMNQSDEHILTFDATLVQDALVILRLCMDMVFELRRKYGNDIVPFSKKSSELTLEQVVKYILDAIQPQRIIDGDEVESESESETDRDLDDQVATHPSVIMQALHEIGIPECHLSFVEKSLWLPDLSYHSLIILMSLFFNPAPQPPYTALPSPMEGQLS